MNTSTIPFGMLFEEPAPVEPSVFPIYDPLAGISFVNDVDGQKKPYVLAENASIRTETVTFIAVETTDEDRRSRIETETFTKTFSETTDSDL